jgi:heme exporter protein C
LHPLDLGLAVLGGGSLIAGMGVAFFLAPTERVMGIVQKIFYLHVPSAIAMGALFVICGVACLVYLARADERVDAVAATAAEVSVVLGAIVLLTGPLWARKAWGAYWSWEPRLVLTLLTVLIYAGYLAVREYGGAPAAARRTSAVLGVAGLPAYYFIKVAVQKWGGNHPKDVVYGNSEGLENPQMKLAFIACLAGVFLFTAVLFWARYRVRRLAARVDQLELEARELELDARP